MMTSQSQYLDADWSRDSVFVRSQPEQVVLASYERSAVTLEEYAKAVIGYAKSSQERARRAAVDKRIKILRDAWGPLLKAAMENWLQPEIQDLVLGANRDQLDLSRNPAKHIWQEQSVLYKLPPKRTTPKNESDIEKYVALLEDTNFDGYWQLVELLLNSCREVVIWPDIITRNGKKIIRHRVECGNTITAIPMAEDKTLIECYLHTYEYFDLFEGKKVQYRLWTDRWHAAFEEDKKGELKRVGYVDPNLVPETDDSAANPYGRMPHCMIRLVDWHDGPWDSTSGEDLVDLTIHGGKERCLYRYMQKVANFKQGVATGNIDHLPQQVFDPGFLIKIEGHDVDFHVVDWTVDLRERLQCMMDDELSAAASYGINPQRYKRTGDYQTSYSAKSAERGLDEIRERSVPLFTAAERAYKESLCIVAAAHGFDNVPSPDVKLEVTFQPISYPEDPRAQVELDKTQIAMGVKSQLDLVKRDHPEWSEDQCQQFLIKTIETIAWINSQKVKYNIPSDPAVQSASAEQNGALGPMARDKAKDANSQPVSGTGTPKPEGSST
jgi:hypothetical protein